MSRIKKKARILSRYIDEELNPEEASHLRRLIDADPELHALQRDWGRIGQWARERAHSLPLDIDEAKRSVLASIGEYPNPSQTDSSPATPSIWVWVAGLTAFAAAAALAIIFFNTPSLPSQKQAAIEPTRIEYVATDIPNASTIVFVDEQTGWTVVWVVDTGTIGKRDS